MVPEQAAWCFWNLRNADGSQIDGDHQLWEFWFCDSFNKYLLNTCYCPGTGGTAWTPNQSEHQIRVNTVRTVYLNPTILISFLQFRSVAQSCPTLCGPWTAAGQASLSITNSWSFLRLISIESVMPSNHLILCLLLSSIFPSIRVFSIESLLPIRWPKYWSFSFSISPSNEFSGLISYRMDLFDLLAVQGTLKSLFQQHSSKT